MENEANLYLHFLNTYGNQIWESGNLRLEGASQLFTLLFDDVVTC